MPDLETLSERVQTLERTLTGGEMPELQDDAELRRTTSDLATRMDDLETELDELDAAVQALRGYVGNIRAVNADVERRADAALATAEAHQFDSDSPEDGVGNGSNRSSPEAISEPPRPKSGGNNEEDDRPNTPPAGEFLRRDSERSGPDDRSLTTRLRDLL